MAHNLLLYILMNNLPAIDQDSKGYDGTRIGRPPETDVKLQSIAKPGLQAAVNAAAVAIKPLLTTTPTPTYTCPYPATLIAIVGPSGSGKSTALRNLPPSSTRIMDMEKKGMPFKVTEPDYISKCDRVQEFKDWLKRVSKDPAVHVIVIDSITALIDILQVECESSYKGFDIWKYYNDGIQQLCNDFKKTGKTVIVTALDEIVQIQGLDGQITTQRRIFIQGKEWANKGIESECLAVWTSFAKKDKDSGNMNYQLATQTDGITKAKTPMFWNLPPAVGNDLHAILEKVAKNL